MPEQQLELSKDIPATLLHTEIVSRKLLRPGKVEGSCLPGLEGSRLYPQKNILRMAVFFTPDRTSPRVNPEKSPLGTRRDNPKHQSRSTFPGGEDAACTRNPETASAEE